MLYFACRVSTTDNGLHHQPRGNLHTTIFILTMVILYFACRVLTTDRGFHHQPRGQSAHHNSPPCLSNTILCISVLITDLEFHHQPRGQSTRQNCHPYHGNTILCMSSLHGQWIQSQTVGPGDGWDRIGWGSVGWLNPYSTVAGKYRLQSCLVRPTKWYCHHSFLMYFGVSFLVPQNQYLFLVVALSLD